MLRQAQHEREIALRCHADTPPRGVTGVAAAGERDGTRLILRYAVTGAETLTVCEGAAERTDGLWRHTCFEAFVTGADGTYREFNFAPSGAWAAYVFDGYRARMRDADAAPAIVWDGTTLAAEVAVDLAGDWRLNLTAVIEERDGTKSYWALAHPGGPPDFHDPACFVLTLPASDAA